MAPKNEQLGFSGGGRFVSITEMKDKMSRHAATRLIGRMRYVSIPEEKLK